MNNIYPKQGCNSQSGAIKLHYTQKLGLTEVQKLSCVESFLCLLILWWQQYLCVNSILVGHRQ